MAIKLLAVNDVYNIREAKYIVDEENEKDLIPNEDKVQGTKVLVIKGNKEYRMNSAGNWVEIMKSGGGGSSLPPVIAEDDGDLLGVVNGEWGKTDAPYMIEETTDETVIFEEDEITLVDQQTLGVANLASISALPQSGDILSVTWNGDVYECTAQTLQGSIFAGNASVFGGDPDWSEYPFLLFMTDNGGQVEGQVVAEHSGTATLAVAIEDTTKTVTVSDAFVDAVTEANNEAKKTWIVPKTLVSFTEPDEYIDIPVSAAALSDITQKFADGSLANTVAFINGNELSYDTDDGAWTAIVGGTEYYMYYNTSPGPVVDSLSISVTTGNGYVYGDYSVGLFTRSGETLTVVFTENGGNYSCDTPLVTIGEAISNGTPINAFLMEGSTRLYPYVLTVVGTSVVAVFHAFSAKTDYFEIKTLTLELASDNTVTATEATKDLQYHQGVN